MPRQKKPPSRERYEAAHPSLTVRVPAAVKTRIGELAQAEGLSVSEWVQAKAGGHEAVAADAYQKGRDDGYALGEKAGRTSGREEGFRVGQRIGTRTGILLDCFIRGEGRAFDAPIVAEQLQREDPDWRFATEIAKEYKSETAFRRYLIRLTKASSVRRP